MDEGTCPGPCNTAYRRARDAWLEALELYDPLDSSQSRPEPPAIRAVYGSPWCSRCASVIGAQLGELDDLAPLRNMTADGHTADSSVAQDHGGSGDPASPSPSADDIDDTYRMVAAWELSFRDLKGWPSPPRRGILATQRTTCIAWLAERLPAILESPIGEDFGLEVMTWHRDLKAKAKAGKRKLEKPLRCPGCKHMTLTWDEGEKYVQCWYCGVLLTYDEYEAEVGRVADGIGRGGIIPAATPLAG